VALRKNLLFIKKTKKQKTKNKKQKTKNKKQKTKKDIRKIQSRSLRDGKKSRLNIVRLRAAVLKII
jgi:hypothetical protein